MPQNLDINRIVEKVLDQIAQGARKKQTAPGKIVKNTGCNEPEPELFVPDRVISLARIERQLAGKRRLAITPGAILTPSVRDYLKEHRISICTATPNTGSSAATQTPITLIAALTTYDPTELTNRLTQQRFNIAVSNSSCLIETTDQLAEQLADPSRLGIILTRHHAAALCLANRHQTLRAASVECEDQLEPIVSAIGANVLIVSPRGRSHFQLERILTRFLRMPNHTCPDTLKSRLA